MNRLITAIGLIAVAVYLIYAAPTAVFWLAALCMSVLCYREYSELVAAHGFRRPGVPGLVLGCAILFFPERSFPGGFVICALICFLIVFFLCALRFPDLLEILPQVACAFAGAFYTFAPWRLSASLRKESVHLLFFALALNWVGDSAAYYVGRRFGRHRLAPVVSPKKSWEGAIGSVVMSVLFGLAYLGYFMPALPWWRIMGLAIAGNIAGQLGDLVESAIKRGAGVKDSGNILPGHGGMLDRVDSSLFALPVVYALYFAGRLF